jgi:hypothetical protein
MQCPGQDTRYWKPGAVFETKCTECGHEVEFFKDETSRKCKKCGHRLLNPKIDFGCASYCKYAEQCLGGLPPELLAGREDLLKDRVAVAMKRYFNRDFKSIGHATRVARYAEQIGKSEQGNLAVILTAAYLHDIGIKEAQLKHQSKASHFQEEEGPAVAREILQSLDAKEPMIDEVCDIIGHHHNPRSEETVNFKAVFDADVITNLEEKQKESPLETAQLQEILARKLLTASGRELAAKVLFK